MTASSSRKLCWSLVAALCGCTTPPGSGPPPRSFMAGSTGKGGPAIVAHPPPPPAAFRDRQRAAKVRSAMAQLDAWIAAERDRRGLPGLAVGVVVDDELVFSKGYGSRDDAGGAIDGDTVFRIGSVTKVFTAMVALQLRDDGKLSLDDAAADHLPELGRLVYPAGDLGRITIRQLLTHTSGLPRLGSFDYTGSTPPDEQRVLASLEGLQLSPTIGSQPHYSNLGMTLMGTLLGRVAGAPYRELVSRRILVPLEMRSTHWEVEEVPSGALATAHDEAGRALATSAHWRMGPAEAAGGLYSSVSDLGRFAALQLSGWPPRSGADGVPMRRASLREAQLMAAFDGLEVHRRKGEASEGEGALVTARGTGLGWQIEQACDLEQLVWHNGGTEGYRSALFLLPRLGVAVIALSNGTKEVSTLARHLLRSLVDEAGLEPRTPQPAPALEEALKEVVSLLKLGNINEPRYQALFDDSFRRQVSLQALREMVSALRARKGSCRPDEIIEVLGPLHARWRFVCDDKSPLAVELALGQTTPGRINLLGMRPGPGEPAPAKTKRCNLGGD